MQLDYRDRLLVTPLLTEEQIGPASVDVRLGSSIIVPKKTYVGSQDVTNPSVANQIERRLYDRFRLQYNTKFVLHPNEMILGVTFEYVALPSNVFCTIASRSSWGRLGLVLATAAIVQPGYKGSLTLELVNLSDTPIALYPGLLVGQLIFHEVTTSEGKAEYDRKRYDCPTEAELPQFYKRGADREMEFWGDRSVLGEPRAGLGHGGDDAPLAARGDGLPLATTDPLQGQLGL